jgi:hypothetical protein
LEAGTSSVVTFHMASGSNFTFKMGKTAFAMEQMIKMKLFLVFDHLHIV